MGRPRFKNLNHLNSLHLVDAIVAYWLEWWSLELTVLSSNPIQGNQPLLMVKAVHRQSSLHVFGTGLWLGKLHEVNPLIVQWSHWEDNCWVPCANGIKLQSLRSVRFWTSLVRDCLKYPQWALDLVWWQIGDWISFLPEPVWTVQSRQLKTKKKSHLNENVSQKERV